MNSLLPCLGALALSCLPASAQVVPDPPIPTANPILFVTQVPTPDDYLTVASTFGNHLGRMKSAPRGGDLWIRYGDGTLRNLTAELGFGSDGLQGENAIAVREPCVHWSGLKAVFSMVVGAPDQFESKEFYWQLYEVRGFEQGQTAAIHKVPHQPENANNTAPAYLSDGRIVFASDRTRGGESHLYPQLDEYEEQPTNTGLWSLDPESGELFLMQHSPSGSFRPIVDNAGRVVYTRWDHLERDQQTDLELMGLGNYGTFNFSDESAQAFDTGSNEEIFPEPRNQWLTYVALNPTYSGPLNGYQSNLIGNQFETFLPWTVRQDGQGEEILNHLGRHELLGNFNRSFNDDPNLFNHYLTNAPVLNPNKLVNFLQTREVPYFDGLYLGIDSRTFFTHASGQIVGIYAPKWLLPTFVPVFYLTHRDTHHTTPNPSEDHTGLYRNPLPLSGGSLIASHTFNTEKDENVGTPTQPLSLFDFRLKFIVPPVPGEYWKPGPVLTGGITKSVTWWDPFKQLSYSGELWELDPVEVYARPAPEPDGGKVFGPEKQILAEEGVSLDALEAWLEARDLALVVSRNVTAREANDKQQPFNLRVPGGVSSISEDGKVYDVSYLQMFQGDQVRGLYKGGSQPVPGRRVLARPMHDDQGYNPPMPGAPAGSVAIAPDGSAAAIVPARRALSWQLVDPVGEPVVRERYWITFQPGEVRTCTNCHGVNIRDQLGNFTPINPPEALRDLLQHLKAQGEL